MKRPLTTESRGSSEEERPTHDGEAGISKLPLGTLAGMSQSIILERRTLPEQLRYLAGRLREDTDPKVVAVCLEIIASEQERGAQGQLGTPVVVSDGDMITIEWSGRPVPVVVCCRSPVTLRDLTSDEAAALWPLD